MPKADSAYYQPGGLRAWIVVLSASLFFLYEFMQLNVFNTINADLSATLNIDGRQISNLSAFYFYADVLFLFPAGIILDYFSTRRLIIAALSLCTVSTTLLAFSHTFTQMAILRTLSGVGAAFCLLSAVRLATRWFPPKHLAVATGVIVTMAMIGGSLAQTPFALLNQHFGWRHTLMVDALLGFVFIMVIAWQVRDYPPGSKAKTADEKALKKMGFWPSVFAAWGNPQNWLAGLYTSFLNLPILVIGALWGTQYLTQVDHFTLTQASLVNMMLFVGTIVGSPVLGWFSDAVGKRKAPMIACAVLSIAVVLMIMYLPHPSFINAFGLFFLLGFITSAQIISYPLIAESNPSAITGSATGWAAVLIMAGGAFGQPLFGYLLNLHWDGTKVHDVPLYSMSNYHFAWWLFPIMFTVAFIISLFIKETYTHRK